MGCLYEGVWLCSDCRSRIPAAPLACVVCGKKRPRALPCTRCQHSTQLTGALAAAPYSSPTVQRGIHWLKFQSVRAVAPALAALLVDPLTVIAPRMQLQQEAAFVPIPLHKRRQQQRGFNQSTELAESLSSLTKIAVLHALVRSRATWAQAKLPSHLRHDNVQQAFRLVETDLPAIAIIIDDVLTSGATLSAAATLLRNAGVRQVWGLTVARG